MKLLKVGFLLLATAFVANAAKADFVQWNGVVVHNGFLPYIPDRVVVCPPPVPVILNPVVPVYPVYPVYY